MSYVYGATAVLTVLIVVTLLIPASKSTTRTGDFNASIEEVWAVYTDFSSQPDWRDEVVSIHYLNGSQTSWVETLEPGGIEIHFSVIEASAPHRLLLKTGNPGSFEGQYTAVFEESDNGTKGTFTEASTAAGYIPKLIRLLLVNQAEIIDKYTSDAQREIRRRQKLS